MAEYAMLLDGTDVRCTVHLEQEELAVIGAGRGPGSVAADATGCG
ncbi:hypothetical protein [Streptomyces rhizosphaericus]|nr:hypothetical protein [Streptomyces rhizosphaericus]